MPGLYDQGAVPVKGKERSPMTVATRPHAQAVLAFQTSEVGRGYGQGAVVQEARDVLGGLPGIEPELGKESVNILLTRSLSTSARTG